MADKIYQKANKKLQLRDSGFMFMFLNPRHMYDQLLLLLLLINGEQLSLSNSDLYFKTAEAGQGCSEVEIY